MEIIKFNKQDFTDYIQEALKNKATIAVYCIYDKTYVLAGNSLEPKWDIIKQYQLDFIDIPIMGGTIIVSPGDIHYGVICPTNMITNDFLQQGIQNLLNLIKKHNLECKTQDNDILVDGYKVASCSSRMVNGVCIGGFHISSTVNLPLIKEICTKEMQKVPKGLSEFGITTEEIEQEVVLKTAHEFSI